ncbi:MAG: biosynthetic arginine decarboxylase, partial [Planctomycetota bacterium]
MTSTTPFQAADAAPPSRWTARDGAAHYGLPGWGAGYFDADDAGRVVVRPDQRPDRSAALDDVLAELARRGVTPPILIRFPQILEHRAGVIRGAFDRAISDAGYRGRYTCVYPVKVNQHRGVLERISALAPALGLGLEAGSKAELIAVLAATADTPGTPIICNGFKDDECLDLIVLAAAMGRPITPIIERRAELDAALRLSDARRVDVALGLRLKLASPGAGRWQASGGLGSKFGLFVAEAADAARDLIHAGLGRRLTVLHSHIGSQIADLGAVRRAARELARVAVELRRLGASITTLDLGGGLGVDYDGGADGPTSIGYTADEYARALVDETRAVFDDAGEPHPDLITESGRALVAHESVLVTDVVGVSAHAPAPTGPDIAGAGASTLAPLRDLARLAERPPGDDPAGALRRALDARDALTGAFTAGRANLADRALGDRLFRVAGLSAVDALTRTGADPPDADRLADLLFDLYFCNFSIFQSLPDLWALGQRFPACPLTRLDERPTRRAVLCDMTCDSDGEMRSFPGPAGVGGGLMLHEPRPGAPYRVGVFLVGAYQEILGDLHNLFGDPGAAHVTIDDAGRAVIEEVIPGDSADDALRLVGHDT